MRVATKGCRVRLIKSTLSGSKRQKGTLIYVSADTNEFLVEFDDKVQMWMAMMRRLKKPRTYLIRTVKGHSGGGRGKNGHCWFCSRKDFEVLEAITKRGALNIG